MRISAFANFRIISSVMKTPCKLLVKFLVNIFIILIIIVNPNLLYALKGDILSRILKIILFIVGFALFFEAGLICSYTIVTSQPPDVGKLVNMQLEEISSFFNFGSNNVLSNQETITILNPYDVANALNSSGNVNSIDVQSLAAITSQDTSSGNNITVNITATGYNDVTSGSNTSSIVISPNSTYSIVATATGKTTSKGIMIDLSTIKITSVKKLYTNS